MRPAEARDTGARLRSTLTMAAHLGQPATEPVSPERNADPATPSLRDP